MLQLIKDKGAANPATRMSEHFTSTSGISDRVKSALSAVATANRINQPNNIPPLPHQEGSVSQSLPSMNLINSQRFTQRARELEVTSTTSSLSSESQTTSTTSSVVIKKRFKHSRPVLGVHATTPDKKFKSALQQLSESYDSNATEVSQSAPHNTSVQNAVTTVQSPSIGTSSLSTTSILSATPMQVLSYTASNPICCPICREESKTTAIGSNFYKCLTCKKTYMPVHRVNVCGNSSSFYGYPSVGTSKLAISTTETATTVNNLVSKKRMANGKPLRSNKKIKTIETVDLVSSDEEEKKDSKPSSETSVSSTVKPGGIAARMKLPGGTVAGNLNTPTPPPPPPTLPIVHPSPSPSLPPVASVSHPPVAAGEYKFHCNKAMFGELYGCTLAPTRVADNRMFLSLECIIYRNDKPVTEKYTLSVGQNDVQHIYIYFGRVPSFVAIETATRFAEVACKRIGRDVLVPGSEDPKKRYIILALVSAFKNDGEAAIELQHLISCVSSWANIQMLSLQEAAELITRANLDVNQQERCYGSQLKPAGPVETLLIYPWPPKKGGIPVTNEDVMCLADGIYLNDIIIDFYLKYLYEGVLTDEQRLKTYIFNSYFYKRLTQKSSKCTPAQMHAAVKKWTRNVDIFEKDFIIIPVNEHCHWYLVVVCFPGQSLDSSKLLNEKDEEESEDESADFNKECSVSEISPPVNPSPSEVLTDQTKEVNVENIPPKLSNPENNDGGIDNKDQSQSDLVSKISEESETNTGTEIKDTPSVEPTTVPIKEKIVFKQAYETEEFHRPCILIFDSLVGSGHARVFTNLRHYLTEEWSSRKPKLPTRCFDKVNMKGCYPKIPRQNNDCDCGVFLLQYVESFFTRQIQNFHLPIHLEDWFTLETVSKKRGEIRELITKLAEEYKQSR